MKYQIDTTTYSHFAYIMFPEDFGSIMVLKENMYVSGQDIENFFNKVFVFVKPFTLKDWLRSNPDVLRSVMDLKGLNLEDLIIMGYDSIEKVEFIKAIHPVLAISYLSSLSHCSTNLGLILQLALFDLK